MLNLKYTLILLLLLPLSLAGIPIATVEHREITYDQLTEEMADLENETDLTYSQIRELALNNLIENEVLLIYAEQNNITVDELELDSFFINHLGDHPRFRTEGVFDRQKYLQFKLTEMGYTILQEMEKEILINKVKSVLFSSFNLTDESLYTEFVLKNAEIDLSYTIVDIDLAAVTEDLTFKNALEYYHKNRDKFRTAEKVKMELIMIPYSDFRDSAENYLNLMDETIFNSDSTYTEIQIDSLKQAILLREMKNRAAQEAEKTRLKLELNQAIDYQIFETGFLAIDDRAGKLPQEVIYNAFIRSNDRFSEPFETEIGYLLFRVVDKQPPRKQTLNEIPEKIWESYIKYYRNNRFSEEFRKYFFANIEEFIISVAVVEIIEIPKYGLFRKFKNEFEQQELIESLTRYRNDHPKFQYYLDRFELSEQTEIIYLNKFKNTSFLNDMIFKRLDNSFNFGTVKSGNNLFFYNLVSYFPEYIPNYKDIEDQFTEVESVTAVDSTEYQEFYRNYKKDFVTPDSLQLGGIHFPAIADSIQIDSLQIYNFYLDNINNYYRGKAVAFDYIYVKDQATAHMIRDYAANGADFDILKFCFNLAEPLPAKQLIPETELPKEIFQILFETRDQAISFPISSHNGWFVFLKLNSFNEGLRKFEDVYNEIKYKFQLEKADLIARSYAKMVFDSTRYYAQCFKYDRYGQLFKTAYQDADKEYEILGYLNEHKLDLLRLWQNEKYSSIYQTAAGYAVVFQLNKRSARQLEYEQALPKIVEILKAKEKLQTAKNYLNVLRERMLQGHDPDSLFFFLGGWKSAENVDLDSDIFGSEYSRLILYDIVGKKEGYCSPVLSLTENQLFLYRIDRLEMISRNVFKSQKEEFKSQVQNERYNDWLNQFKSNMNIYINY